jgi:hypothetical protein
MSNTPFYYTDQNDTQKDYSYTTYVRNKIKGYLNNKERVDFMQSQLNSLIPNKFPIFLETLLCVLYETNEEISKQFYCRTLWWIYETKNIGHGPSLIDGLLFPIDNVPEKIIIKYRVLGECFAEEYTIGKVDEKLIVNEKEYFIWQPADFIIPMFGDGIVSVFVDAGDIDVTQIIPICGNFGKDFVCVDGILTLLASNNLTMPILKEKFVFYDGIGLLPKK